MGGYFQVFNPPTGTHGWDFQLSNTPTYPIRGGICQNRVRDSQWVVNMPFNPPTGHQLVIITHPWVPQPGGYPTHPVGMFAAYTPSIVKGNDGNKSKLKANPWKVFVEIKGVRDGIHGGQRLQWEEVQKVWLIMEAAQS